MTKFLILFTLTLFYTAFNPALADGFGVEIIHDKTVTLTGIIEDEPRKYVVKDGLTESFSFYLTAGDGTRGNESVSVMFNTKTLGHRIAKFEHKKGDKITITGRAVVAQNHNTYKGLIKVNDYPFKELSKFPKEN